MTTAIVLAGGFGTRLRSVLPDLPKPMAPIKGRPFLEYLMDYWISQGVSKFVFSVGYKKEVIIEYFGNSYRSVPIHYSVETRPLGTGGALLVAARDQTGSFLVLNGDTFFEVIFSDLLSFHINKAAELTLSLFRTDDQQRFGGVDVDHSGALISLNSASSMPGELANGGVYLINSTLLFETTYEAGEAVSLEKDLIPYFLAQRREVYATFSPGRFIDIGIPSDLIRATTFIKASGE